MVVLFVNATRLKTALKFVETLAEAPMKATAVLAVFTAVIVAVPEVATVKVTAPRLTLATSPVLNSMTVPVTVTVSPSVAVLFIVTVVLLVRIRLGLSGPQSEPLELVAR